MFERLNELLARYNELKKLTVDPEVTQNISLYQNYAKELARLRPAAEKYETYLKTKRDIDALKKDSLLHASDNEYLGLINEEIKKLETDEGSLENELEDIVYADDADSGKDIIMEIRAGTGGVEAALFAADLFRMYSKYAAKRGWIVEQISSSMTEKNGVKEVIFSMTGSGVFGRMKYESGTHRVQRVPETEASGRIHTSAATVAVLPEAEEIDVKVNPQDLQVDVFRAGGKGGQHVNKTDSAVRITHIPTGIVVTCQDERSQHKNKTKAMRVLRTRLYEMVKVEQESKISRERKIQVGTGDRSEKIRTYNFPDRRVTDHRIGLTLHKLEDILEGDLDEIINALKAEERKIKRGQK